MQANRNPEITLELASLQLVFKQKLPDTVAEIKQGWDELSIDAVNYSKLEELHSVVISLADSAGTYGAASVSQIAREIELAIKSLINATDKNAVFVKIQTKLDVSISELKTTAKEWGSPNIPSIETELFYEKRNENLVFLLASEKPLISDLLEELEKAYFRVKVISGLSEIKENCEIELPITVIVDEHFTENGLVGIDVIRQIKILDNSGLCPPFIFITEQDSVDLRLKATRAGVSRYFCKPLKMNKLIHSINGLKRQSQNSPYKVLLIDNDEPLLECYKTILHESGMIVQILSKSLDGLKMLADFKPDVIVLDVNMPDCSGSELANMIRLDEQWDSTPIIFLSAEQDVNNQLEAMKSCADDFIVKPVQANKFVALVDTVVKRTRKNIKLNNDLKNALRENKTQLNALDQHALVSTTDVTGRITLANDKFCETSGYTRKELIGSNHRILKSNQHSSIFYKGMWETVSSGEVWHGTICNLNKQGEEYWVESSIIPFLDDKGIPYKYISIRTDITKRKIDENALIAAREEADQANRAKSHFLSSMSHELRTPMNAIMGFSQLLKIEKLTPLNEVQKDNVDEIILAGNHLMTLIDEILDLAKIEAGSVDLSMENVFIGKVMAESLQLIMPLAQRRGIEISLHQNDLDISLEDLSQQNMMARADYSRLKQVLINLLSNAVKYNNENGKIIINCNQVNEKQISIGITDTGLGLSRSQQEQLFTSFNRLGAEQTEVEGTGIGLVISKNITELMGGYINVESQPGVGSTFSVILTCEPVKLGFEHYQNNIDTNPILSEIPFSELGHSHNVLYIEDNAANMRLVNTLLGRLPNLNVLTAVEPVLGIELAIKHLPDLILLDINLPGMNGYDVLKCLKESEITKDIPVVAISANAMTKDIEKGIQAGFMEYIVKPVDVTKLLQIVCKVLADSVSSEHK